MPQKTSLCGACSNALRNAASCHKPITDAPPEDAFRVDSTRRTTFVRQHVAAHRRRPHTRSGSTKERQLTPHDAAQHTFAVLMPTTQRYATGADGKRLLLLRLIEDARRRVANIAMTAYTTQ
jgi:hypothetical protein